MIKKSTPGFGGGVGRGFLLSAARGFAKAPTHNIATLRNGRMSIRLLDPTKTWN